MAIDASRLQIDMPDQVRIDLRIPGVLDHLTMSLNKWSNMTDEDRQQHIQDWAMRIVLDTAIVTVTLTNAPKSATRDEPRPIKDNPQA